MLLSQAPKKPKYGGAEECPGCLQPVYPMERVSRAAEFESCVFVFVFVFVAVAGEVEPRLQVQVGSLREFVCSLTFLFYRFFTGESFTLKMSFVHDDNNINLGLTRDLQKLLQVFSADRKAFHNRCITCQVLLLLLLQTHILTEYPLWMLKTNSQ